MLTRVAIYEGSIKAGQEEVFFGRVQDGVDDPRFRLNQLVKLKR